MVDRLQRLILVCGLTLASVSLATTVLADETETRAHSVKQGAKVKIGTFTHFNDIACYSLPLSDISVRTQPVLGTLTSVKTDVRARSQCTGSTFPGYEVYYTAGVKPGQDSFTYLVTYYNSGVGTLTVNETVTVKPMGSLDLSQFPYYDKTNDGSKANIESYAVAKGPKALAINPNGQSYWWGPVAQQAEASRRALENCELSNKSPCVLAAIDDGVQKLDPAAKLVSAFAALGNELDPSKVPFLSDAARKSLATSLEKARNSSPQYMALALNPRNGWFLKVDPAFASQADADNAALAACVNFKPPNKSWNRGSCLLFSQGTQIVANLPLIVTFASAAMVEAAGR